MTDYAEHANDPVRSWIVDMSYKVCLKYGLENGTPAKAAEAKSFQAVFASGLGRANLDYDFSGSGRAGNS